MADPANTQLAGSPDDSPSVAAAIPTLVANPTESIIPFIPTSALATSNVPLSTDSANYATNNSSSEDKGVLNYYFLLLAVFIIVLASVYWSIARRRRRKFVVSRNGQQSALAQDLQSWPGGRNGVGRWRLHTREPRVEEGLDERGEAPPPYLKEPEAVHHGNGEDEMELQDLSRREGKPPDYEETPVGG